MKTYIGVLALVLAVLLSYGIAWRLDSGEPAERPSRRLLDHRRIAAGEAEATQLTDCSVANAHPASAKWRQPAVPAECGERP